MVFLWLRDHDRSTGSCSGHSAHTERRVSVSAGSSPDLPSTDPVLPRRPGWALSIVLDGLLAASANLAAYWLRFQGDRFEAFLPGRVVDHAVCRRRAGGGTRPGRRLSPTAPARLAVSRRRRHRRRHDRSRRPPSACCSASKACRAARSSPTPSSDDWRDRLARRLGAASAGAAAVGGPALGATT